MVLAEKTVVLGMGGGIAAYKAAELVRLLRKEGADVYVAMTRAAQQFVTPLTLQTLSGHAVMTDLFDLTQESEIGHIRLADDADLVLVAPATADLIARLAAGIADDPVTTVVLATRAPVLLCPAMNVNMWEHPLTRRNIDTLGATGRYFVAGPGAGELACGWVGAGRMIEPDEAVWAARQALSPKDLSQKRVLVTAGPTWEPVDRARVIANRSSGKMGYALARAAALRGAKVELVSGPVALPAPPGVARTSVETALEMREAVLARWQEADVVVMAAAVADFRPPSPPGKKIRKRDFQGPMRLELVQNPDILAELGAARRGKRPLLVGFAAETPEGGMEVLALAAKAKLAEKRCDLMVANDVTQPDAGFAVDTNRVLVVSPSAPPEPLGPASKESIAHLLWDRIVRMLLDAP